MKNKAVVQSQSDPPYICRVKCIGLEDFIDASTVGPRRRKNNISLYFVSGLDQFSMYELEQSVNVDMKVTQDHVPEQVLACLAKIKDQDASTPYLIFDVGVDEGPSSTELQGSQASLENLATISNPSEKTQSLEWV